MRDILMTTNILESSQDAALLNQRQISYFCIVFRMTVGHRKETTVTIPGMDFHPGLESEFAFLTKNVQEVGEVQTLQITV